MKLRLLTFVLLLAAVPGWADDVAATASPEPSRVGATACTGAPMTPTALAADPFLGAPALMSPARIALACLACKEFVPTCQSPGQDDGKACGDGNPPDTCTCKRCDHTFGCFP